MPVIRLEFDDAVVSDQEALILSQAIRDIVSKETAIADVFVYANSARIKVQVAPVEIFIEMSAHKIKDTDDLAGRIGNHLRGWKQSAQYPHLLNLTLIPMTWKIEIGI